MSKSFKNKDELAQWALQQYGGGSSSNGQAEQGAPQKNKDDFAQWALQQYGGTGNPSSGAGAPPSPQGEGFGQQEAPKILKPSQMQQLQQQGRFTDTGTGDRFGRQGRNVTDPSTAARSPSPAGRGGFDSGALGRQTQGLFNGMEHFGRSNLEKDSNAQGVLYEAAGGQIARATASMQQAGERLDRLNSAFNSSIKPYEQDLDARKQAYEAAVAEMQAAADRGDVRAYQAALLRAEEASSAYDLAYQQYQSTWDNLYRAYKGAWDQASKEYEGASADYEKARQNASGAYENLRKNGVFEESEKEQQYGYDPEKARTNRDYYTAHIDAAIAQGDYAQASWWMDKLVSAPLGKEERDRAVRYIHEVYGNLEQLGSNEDAAKRLSEAYERDARAFAELITGDDGPALLREVEEKYKIPASLAYQDPDAYAAAVRNARGSDFAAASSDREWQAYNEFSGSKQYWLTQNAQNAFLKRAEDTMQRAEHSQMRSAQMDSYTRAQQAVFALDELRGRLDVNGGLELGLFDSSGKVQDYSAKYLIDELKGYGVDLSGLNAENFRELIEQAYELSGSRVRMMGDALRSDGYDMDAVFQYLEYQRDLRIEEDRNKSAREWAKQQAEAAREFRERHRQEGAEMLEPWDPAYAGTASFEINEGLWNQVIASLGTVAENSVLSGFENIPTWAKLLGPGGDVNRPNEYVPVAPQTKQSDLLRSAIGEQMSDAGQFWYNAVMSWADSTANAAMFGGVGFGGAPAMGILGDAAGEIFTQAGTLATMGMNAATSQANEILKRGGSRSQAIAGGLAAGVVETLTEIYSVENLIHLSEGLGYKQLVKELLKSFVSEGSEEVAGNILDKIIDNLNMGNLSEDSVAVKNYVAQGMSYQEAQKRVLIDNLRETLEAGLSGGLSGAFSTVAVGVPASIAQDAQIREYREQAYRPYEQLAQSDAASAALRDYAKGNQIKFRPQQLGETTAAVVDSLQQKMQGKTAEGVQSVYELTVRQYGEGMADAAKLAAARALEEQLQDVQSLDELRAAYKEISASITQDGVKEALLGACVARAAEIRATEEGPSSASQSEAPSPQGEGLDEAGNPAPEGEGLGTEEGPSSAAAAAPSPKGEGFGGQVARATGEDTGRLSAARSMSAATGEDAGRLSAAQSMSAATREDAGRLSAAQSMSAATETGGLNNGRTEGFDDGAQRDAGLGAAEQAAGVEGRAGGQLAGGQTRESDARKKALIAAYTAEPRSARDLGIRTGGTNATLQVIEDQSIWTSDMQEAYEDARKNGHEITFVKGPIEIRNPQTKQYDSVGGVWQTNADGSTQFIVRADLRGKSAGQVYRHEAFHAIVSDNPQLWQQMANYLTENYTEAEQLRLLEAYVEAFRGIYGMDEGSEMYYLEEAFADVYAETQRGRADGRIVRETMQAFGDQIDNARRNAQTSEATRETRGSPEQRYSMEMFNDESDSDKAKRLKNASVEIVQASPESLQAAANIDVSNSKAQDTASILFPILEEFGIFGNQYNQALEIEFDYSKTAGARSLSHQIEITGKNYTAQALVQTNLRELCEKAYPVEAHADEKASDPEAALKQIITLYSALQAGDDAVFAKMTIKIPQKESNRLHMVVTSEVKKGFDLALIAEATKPLSADKSNPRISIPAFLENVKNIGEFTKRIPVDLVLGESANYKDGLGVSGPGLGRQGESKDTTYLAAVEHGDMETAQRMVDEAARDAGYTIKVYHGTTQETISATKGRVPASEYAALEKNYADKLFPFVVFKENGFHTGIYTATDRGVAEDFTFSFSHGGTIYDLYARSENPLVIDAQKRGWNNLPKSEAARVGLTEDVRQTLDSYKKTRTKGNVYMDDLVEFAKKNKYDAVIVENVRETGSGDETSPLTTDVVVFSSKQLKSADPVTYDDAGNVIPLSERFNPGKEDIRYSMAEEEDLGDGLGVNAPGLGRIGEEDSSAAPQNDMTEEEAGRLSAAQSMSATTGEEAGRLSAAQSMSAPTGDADYHALAREKKRAMAEKASRTQLNSRIESAENRLKGLQESRKILQEMGLWNGEARSRLERDISNVRETLEIERAALSEKAKEERKTREKGRETERKAVQPKIAKRDFRTDALNLFSIQAGSRQELGAVLDAFADRVIREGSISYEDRQALLQQLFERGIEVAPADAYYQEIRNQLRGGRIYVNEDVRAEFGDDWEDFRKRAWGSGIYLTNNSQDTGIDTWNQDLASSFPGSFDTESTDLRQMLEAMVDLAEEGKAEHLTLEQMMQRNEQQYGVSVDEQMDELERKLDQLLDKFAEKANLEMETRRRGMMELVKERQAFRDMIAREAAKRLEKQKRNEVMQQIRQINKMRRRSDNEIRAKIDEILGNLDTVARSISPQGIENLQALAQIYNQAKEDPNFLPNPYVEERLERLRQTQLDDMKIEDVIELGRTIAALTKAVQDQNRMLADARHQEISKAASQVYQEISKSKGSRDGKLASWLKFEHVSPTRMIQQLGGWLRGGEMERLASTLEQGEIRQLEYMRGAQQFFDEFVQDKANRKWLQKASGKNAEWIRLSVPVGYEGTETGAKVKMQEIRITPMMRVSLILHARNADNLRHIQTGGITIPDRTLYHKGDMANAYAKGVRIKMTPETVRNIISGATAQERAFANVLHKYFNEYSAPRINEVSMQIDGFERAGGENYYHIKTDPKFLSSLPATVQQNLSLESIGSIVNERVHAGTPIVLEDASQALTEHIETISKYYGYTAAIRDFNAVMNYTFHEVGNAFDGSIKEVLAQKWGADAQKYLDRLMADLQQKSSINETAAKILSKLRGNLAGATLMLNPAVAVSQTASYPGAMQTLGVDGLLYGLRLWEKADMKLVEKYSPLYWYRNQGNSTQELGDYMSEQGLEQKLPWLLNWIQKMDSATIRRLWVASEYRVRKDTGMKPGSAQEIEAGADPYYQKVAEVFNRAVLDTQPNYTTMERPQILRTASDLTKFLTMYKTVPLQYYNMMFEAVGRLQADQERAKAEPENKQAQEDLRQSRSFAAKTFTGILTANAVYVLMKALIKGLTGRAKKYEDEEGKLFTEAMWKQLGLDLTETFAGSIIGGTELLQVLETAIGSAAGKKLKYYGTEISALGIGADIAQNVIDLAGAIGSMDLKDGLDAIRQTALNLATGMGIPVKNAETYLKSLMKWIAPEWVARFDNFFNEVEKSDLSGQHGKDLDMAVQMLMENRTEGIGEDTVEELGRLYAAGQKNALPSKVPDSVKINNEDVPMDADQKKIWRETWSGIVSGALEELLASDRYLQANDEAKGKLIEKLYDYAGAAASAAAVEEYEPDNWVQQGQTLSELGVGIADYLDFYLKQQELSSAKERMEALQNSGWTEEQKEAYWLGNMASDKQAEKYGYLKQNGTGWTEAMDLLNVGEKDSSKLTEAQQARYDEVWNQTVEDAIGKLYGNDAYRNADTEGKTAYLNKLYDFAGQIASAAVNDGYSCDRWVSAGQKAMELGVSLADYLVYASEFNRIDGKGSDGKTVEGLETYRKIELLQKTGWTDKQKEAVYFGMVAENGQDKKAQALLDAGLNAKLMLDVMGVYGDKKDWNRAAKIIESNAPEKAKIEALSLYLGRDKLIAVQAGYRFGVDMSNWVQGWNTADTNNNGALDQKEVTTFIDSLQLSTQEKAYLWQMLTTSSGWKKNPYSRGMGKEIKEWMTAEQEKMKAQGG